MKAGQICWINSLYFFLIFQVTFLGTANSGYIRMRDLSDLGVALSAVCFAMRRSEMLLLIYMEHLKITGRFESYKAGITMTCKTAAMVFGKRGIKGIQ